MPDYKYTRNKPESELPTLQAEYSRSCECLESCLAMEGSMMKSSTLFHVIECDPHPPYVHLASTQRHSRARCAQAFPVFHHSSASVYYTECNSKNKNGGGLETRLPISYGLLVNKVPFLGYDQHGTNQYPPRLDVHCILWPAISCTCVAANNISSPFLPTNLFCILGCKQFLFPYFCHTLLLSIVAVYNQNRERAWE